MNDENIREAVRARYGKIAKGNASRCCGGGKSCETDLSTGATDGAQLGYSLEDLKSLPAGADMGLGCGNPQAIASLKPGETVIDLGSGGGIDCFLAARQVGDSGHVIGVDMTPDMVSKARQNAGKAGFPQVEFRLGEIEHIPVADNTADVIISNCVINLSPDKPQVLRDSLRALRPGGRVAISDIVATAELPPDVKKDMAVYTGCMAGASLIKDLEAMLKAAGFIEIRIEPKDASREFIKDWVPGRKFEDYVVSANITARKPGGAQS
jgi:SAM-dependent methyltransferase